MARPYNALRRVMLSRGAKLEDIADVLKCTRQTVSNKLRNVSPWTLDEMWAVMDTLAIDPAKMHRYFPRSGKNE